MTKIPRLTAVAVVSLTILSLCSFAAWSKNAGYSAPAYPITKEDKAFFTKVQNAVLHDRKEWLANHIFFPLNVFPTPGKEGIATRDEFLQHYHEIITPYVRQEVKKQKAEELFKNWQGIMIGDGSIWLNKLGEPGSNSENGPWTYYIVTINNQP